MEGVDAVEAAEAVPGFNLIMPMCNTWHSSWNKSCALTTSHGFGSGASILTRTERVALRMMAPAWAVLPNTRSMSDIQFQVLVFACCCYFCTATTIVRLCL